MNLDAFNEYIQQGFTQIPLIKCLPADLDTPLSVYLKVANTPNSYLFESVHGGEKWGRYSIIGLECNEWISVRGKIIEHHCNDQIERLEVVDPLDYINEWKDGFRIPKLKDSPLFSGGLVGYFGYETIAFIEERLCFTDKLDSINAPDIFLMVSQELVVFDNLKGEMHLIVHADASKEGFFEASERLEGLSKQLRTPYSQHSANDTSASDSLNSVSDVEFSERDFKEAVTKIREYIYSGDVMQVVLARRFSMSYHNDPVSLYRSIRNVNPSPYLYFMRLFELDIIGASPEILVRLEEGEVTVRPIAGTRPRGVTVEEDKSLEEDLLNDPKELAEHLMLIDLGRNDAGRVSKVGSVHLNEKFTVERYSHVMHIASNVTGQLRDGLNAIDVLRASFPAGTVSGAPKVRAMEIINELEPSKRGIYSGAVGYLGWHNNMDLAIAIRTTVLKDNTLYIQAGAGIVADSTPDSEWQETTNKAQAMVQAVKQVKRYE